MALPNYYTPDIKNSMQSFKKSNPKSKFSQIKNNQKISDADPLLEKLSQPRKIKQQIIDNEIQTFQPKIEFRS